MDQELTDRIVKGPEVMWAFPIMTSKILSITVNYRRNLSKQLNVWREQG